jgi:hypothetical protein
LDIDECWRAEVRRKYDVVKLWWYDSWRSPRWMQDDEAEDHWKERQLLSYGIR